MGNREKENIKNGNTKVFGEIFDTKRPTDFYLQHRLTYTFCVSSMISFKTDTRGRTNADVFLLEKNRLFENILLQRFLREII